jgi:A/G-specific adenine glycosylase
VSELPTPKPKKITPIKTLTLLILQNNQRQVLLEKRPPIGIWGGLWSLPEFKTVTAAQHWCSQKNSVIQYQKQLNSQRHTFSHYHLDYTPLFVQSDKPTDSVMESAHFFWYKVEQINALALPAPIRQLLQHTLVRKNDKNDSL